MKATNQVLVQLREANRYACAKSPHHRRLAVILLDNVVEVQLARKAEWALAVDRTTWYEGVRKHGASRRWQIENRFGELTKFACENKWIDERDVQLLKYAHRVRNAFYHRAKQDEVDGELAIVLLYRFIKKRFPKWGNASWGFMWGHGDPLPMERSGEDATGVRPIKVKGMRHRLLSSGPTTDNLAYWTEAVNSLLTYKPRIGIRKLIHRRATELLDRLQWCLEFIDENKGLNLLDVLIHRFNVLSPVFWNEYRNGKKINSPAYVVNIYMALLHAETGKPSWEERLLDEKDPQARATQVDTLLHSHKPKPLMTAQQVEKYREQIDAGLKKNEAEGVKTFLRIESETEVMADVLNEFVGDLDGYISHLIDVARGK